MDTFIIVLGFVVIVFAPMVLDVIIELVKDQ